MGYSYRLMRAKDDVDVEEALKQDLKKTVGLYNDMAKGLMSNWTVAAFLADPFHVIKYREEVQQHGTLRLEAVHSSSPVSCLLGSLHAPFF